MSYFGSSEVCRSRSTPYQAPFQVSVGFQLAIDSFVTGSMTNHSPLASLDDSWQNAHTRRRTIICTVDKHIDVCTFVPVPIRSVDSFLNVGSVNYILVPPGR